MDKSYIAYSKTYEYQKYFMRKYYHENRESILEYKKQKVHCSCGSVICLGDVRKHQRTKKHKSFEISLLDITVQDVH